MNNIDKFSVLQKENGNIISLYLNGYLDAHTAPVLENEINSLIQANKYFVLVNFKNLDYISSAGLGVFMAFVEEIRDNNGDIKLTEMNEKVFSVFDLLGFPILFDIEQDDSSAIEKFEKGDLRTNE